MQYTENHASVLTADVEELENANPTFDHGRIIQAITAFGSMIKVGDGVTPYNDLPAVSLIGSTPIGAQVRRTGNLALTSGVNIYIPWQAVTWENGDFFSFDNLTRLTVPEGVSYVDLAAGVTLETGHEKTDGRLELHIIKNRVGAAGTGKQHVDLVGGGENVNVYHGIHRATPGDYFEARAFLFNATDGTSIEMTNNVSTWFQIKAY